MFIKEPDGRTNYQDKSRAHPVTNDARLSHVASPVLGLLGLTNTTK